MSKFKKEKVMPRYLAVAVVLSLIGIAVIAKASYTMTVKKSYWMTVANNQKSDSDSIRPNRGNILSCDGQLLASSIPEYEVFIDFRAGDPKDTAWVNKRDSIWNADLDSICRGLNQLFPKKTVAEHKAHLTEGHDKKARHWPIVKGRIDYNSFTEVVKLPFFNMPKHKGGFHYDKHEARRRPFGSLAQRTIGDMYGRIDSARCGLELSFDSVLRGKKGLKYTEKVLNKFVNRIITPPEDGADVITTLDIGIQDIAERALLRELHEINNAELGVAIVMEVQTGDIKAMVNMTRCSDGKFREIQNHAVSYLCEPGSVFKTASILVALDDEVCDTMEWVDTGNGVYNMHGSLMKDHNWHRGGYGGMRLPHTLEVSSNVGVSRIIDKYYGKNPEKFVEGIHRIGLADDLHVPIPGYTPARIRMPEKNERGQYTNWYKTSLAWMSIGYETQVPPIATVTFYNAIANDGRMMQPRLVKALQKEGKIVHEYPPVVLREQIAKPQTIATMQTILTHVVSQGLGRKAGPGTFPVAGKTGTAQVSGGKAGYHSGIMQYWLSFCGFFPANKPRYTCIVCLKKAGLPASGGGMSGVVFREIAENVMAQDLVLHTEDARDANSNLIPDVKNGDIQAADFVLNELNVAKQNDMTPIGNQGTPVWGQASHDHQKVTLQKKDTQEYMMPDITGMGARDAVFILEKRGVKVRLRGTGSVKSQSIPFGTKLRDGMVCDIELG